MKLPETLEFTVSAHGSGVNGRYIYVYRDTLDMGVQMTAMRPSEREAETQEWRYRALPDQTFGTFGDLCAAAEYVTEEQDAAERAKWPVATLKPDALGHVNRCSLCPREPRVASQFRVHLQESWMPGIGTLSACLCAEHAKLADNPAALATALKARRA